MIKWQAIKAIVQIIYDRPFLTVLFWFCKCEFWLVQNSASHKRILIKYTLIGCDCPHWKQKCCMSVFIRVNLWWEDWERENKKKVERMGTNGVTKTEREIDGIKKGKGKKSETVRSWLAGSIFLRGWMDLSLFWEKSKIDERYTEDKKNRTIRKSRNSAVLFRQALIFNISLTRQTYMDVTRAWEAERKSSFPKPMSCLNAYYLNRQLPS